MRQESVEISCRQILREDSSVYSMQWMTLAARHAESVAPPSLLERYLVHVRRFTLSLVRPVRHVGGIDFRFLALRTPLISFYPPQSIEGAATSSLAVQISGGALVQAGGVIRGELSFITEQTSGGIRITILLSDYCPLLLGRSRPGRVRKLFYRLTQALIHRAVTVRFLARLHHELEGPGSAVRVVLIRASADENI